MKVSKYRIQGRRFERTNPDIFKKSKASYEEITGRSWSDPGRIYLFWKETIGRVDAGQSQDEAERIAAEIVQAIYPRFNVSDENEHDLG